MGETRFTYVVNPRRPIKGIQDIPAIKSSKTLKLTKEEAIACMKCGPVYRKFANEGIQERVTTANIDRLHKEKFITEKEFSGTSIPVISTGEATTEIEKVPEKVEVEPHVVNDNSDNKEVIENEEKKEVEEFTESAENISGDPIEQSDADNIIEDDSDSVVAEEEENSEEPKEVNDNQQSNVTVDYNNNRSRKKKRHRNN